jgi:glutamate racemase
MPPAMHDTPTPPPAQPTTPLRPTVADGPIGVFDSGVGGLSVLRALRARLPGESFVYVADSGHAPYGDRPVAAVEARAHAVANFLVRCRARAMVIACNTASVVAAGALRRVHALPIVAMEPAIKPAVQATRSGVVLVLATTATVRSASVARLCATHGAGVRIVLQACPGLADQVERGDFDGPATRELLRDALLPALADGADTVVLGCTHYAFLAPQIAAIAGPGVQLVEPSDAIAAQLMRVLPAAAGAPGSAVPTTTFYTSGPRAAMAAFLSTIGEPVDDVQAWPDGVADVAAALNAARG